MRAFLAELLWAVDRSYMMEDEFDGDNRPIATITLSNDNFGTYPMGNGLTRLETRFLGEADRVATLKDQIGTLMEASEADENGLVTMILDDIDWEDEVRIFLEERASFSPDAMTGMEANLRFAGPETMETRIFGRLTAWQTGSLTVRMLLVRTVHCNVTDQVSVVNIIWNAFNPR